MIIGHVADFEHHFKVKGHLGFIIGKCVKNLKMYSPNPFFWHAQGLEIQGHM